MIEGPIRDDLDGVANQTRLRELRDAIAARCAAAVPFLLLPVRIETRFAQVDAPAASDGLVAGLGAIRDRLVAIAERPLATQLGDRPRRAVVREERVMYARLDAELDELTAQVGELAAELPRCADVAALPALAAIAAELPAVVRRAAAQVQTLRSRYQGARYADRIGALSDAGLAPLLARVRDEVAPRLELLAELRAARGRGATRAVAGTQLDRSARALATIATTLAARTAALAAPPRQPADEIAAAEQLLADLRAIQTRCREVALVPAARRSALAAAAAGLATAFEPWRRRLVNLATGGGATGARAAALVAQTAPELAAIADALRFTGRPDALAPDAVAGGTRDELWVRIFPDDVAIHTHEPGLTEAEVASARAFWEATIDATTDAGRRDAWRALVARHGVRRAAYVADAMRPSAAPGELRAAAPPRSPVDAVVTLDRRLTEIAAAPGWYARDPARRLARATRAAHDARAVIEAGPAPTAADRNRMRGLVDVSRARTRELGGRLERRGRFLSAPARDATALAELTDALDQLTAAIDAAATPPRAARAALEFPAVETRPAAWSTAPHCRVLPERFVAIAVTGGRVVHAVVGEPVRGQGDAPAGVPDGALVVGPDPTAKTPALTIVDGAMVAAPPLQWMIELDAAVATGMAIRIPITAAEARDGFDELFVLGVRAETAELGQARLEELLTNHRFGEQGLAFLPIGTPTNNTEHGPSAYQAADDPDRAYDAELGAPLFDAADAGADARDGLRFAAALGIAADTVAHVAGADGRDGGRATLVNRALWPATLGAYADEMIGTLMSADTARRLQAYFTAHVSARGALPAVRVGPQPYGVLTTTAFGRYAPAGGRDLPAMPNGPAALPEVERQRRFDVLLVELLAAMQHDWTRVREARVARARPGASDPQRDFVEILGLHAVGVAASYRFALNVANRHPGVGDDAAVRFGFSPQGPLGVLQHFQEFFTRAFGVAPGPLVGPDGRVTPGFADLYRRVADERVYDVRVLDRTMALTGPVVGDTPAQIAELIAARPRDLVVAGARRDAPTPALLYLLLRQALLVQLRRAALDLGEVEGLLTAEARGRAGAADEFVIRNLEGDDHVSKWSYVFAPLARLDGRFGIAFPSGPGTLYGYLGTGGSRTLADYLDRRGDNPLFAGFTGPRRAAHEVIRAELDAHARDVAALASIPADALDGLVREHLDLASHRLDAWRLGLANRRLAELRAATPAGIYLGAFGWVEDLRPGGARALADDVPAALVGDAPVYSDADDQGFVHTPSLSHAVTAAILRSGHLTERSAGEPTARFAINLSSRRVRDALELLDGVEAGHELGALLGYRFERELHDAADATTPYDDLIPGFRRAFPATVPVDPANPAPERATRLVTDGAGLLAAVQVWIEASVALPARTGRTIEQLLTGGGAFPGYPWGVVGPHGERVLPRPPADHPADGRRLPTVVRAIDRLADAIDAIGDLAVAESIYQIVRGNFPRAAAVLAAVAEGRPIARPLVVETPRSGTAVVHRVLLPLAHLPVGDGGPPAPHGWGGVPVTPRAIAAPGLNHWIAELLGDPATIRLRHTAPASGALVPMTIDALGLQPIDLLAMIGPGVEAAEAELAARVRVHALGAVDVGAALAAGSVPAIDVRLVERDPSWGPEVRTLYEVGALLAAAHDVVAAARPVAASDLVATAAVDPSTDPPRIDAAELAARTTAVAAQVRAIAIELMAVLDGGTWSGIEPAAVDPASYAEARRAGLLADPAAIVGRYHALARVALRAAALGARVALPPTRFAATETVAAELVAAVANGFVALADRLRRAAGLADRDALRELAGPSVPVIPYVEPHDAGGLRDQLASSALLRHAGPFTIAAFLDGAAAVREPLRHLARLGAIASGFGVDEPVPAVAQLPARADDYWLGAAVPPGTALAGDRCSLVVLGAARWALGAGPIAALVVDQWTDVIPEPTVTTGIAMHYDAPDATPPQAMLLAVPPVLGGAWSWDDLVHTLHDTLALARDRTVELEHLADEVYGQLLPAVTGELVPERLGGVETSGDRVILDFGLNNRT